MRSFNQEGKFKYIYQHCFLDVVYVNVLNTIRVCYVYLMRPIKAIKG